MLRRVQMYIDEDPGNHLLNKSKTILMCSIPLLLFRQLGSAIFNTNKYPQMDRNNNSNLKTKQTMIPRMQFPQIR